MSDSDVPSAISGDTDFACDTPPDFEVVVDLTPALLRSPTKPHRPSAPSPHPPKQVKEGSAAVASNKKEQIMQTKKFEPIYCENESVIFPIELHGHPDECDRELHTVLFSG